MALLTVALLFCAYTVTQCAGENEEFRAAAPSVLRLCHDIKHKPLFCLICKGFDFSCFTSTNVTLPPTLPPTLLSTLIPTLPPTWPSIRPPTLPTLPPFTFTTSTRTTTTNESEE